MLTLTGECALRAIALFCHIAHNMEHLLMEGPKVVGMICFSVFILRLLKQPMEIRTSAV